MCSCSFAFCYFIIKALILSTFPFYVIFFNGKIPFSWVRLLFFVLKILYPWHYYVIWLDVFFFKFIKRHRFNNKQRKKSNNFRFIKVASTKWFNLYPFLLGTARISNVTIKWNPIIISKKFVPIVTPIFVGLKTVQFLQRQKKIN